ncbi:MAG: deoxyhypusine synthase [Methanobacteriaceae archaeon]|nr:deoxyhypusine synthase [Methanobacteriaceae archaeon]
MALKENMTVLELIEEMGKSGVLGAGKIEKATKLLAKAINDKETAVFLSITGPIVPGGLRRTISDLIKKGYVDVIITSGANITHDLVEAFGGHHYRGYEKDDEALFEEGIGRIGDLYTKSEDFELFEKKIIEILDDITSETSKFNIRELLTRIGEMVDDEESILRNAALNNVPIYAPGLIDSMLGLQLWMYTQTNNLNLDAVGDMHQLSDIVFSSEKVAAVILGGGLPKHYALASNLLRGGVDQAIQITMDRSETGSLSGAPLEEAKSWAKAKAGSDLVTVIGDVTIIFPLIMAGAIDILNKNRPD